MRRSAHWEKPRDPVMQQGNPLCAGLRSYYLFGYQDRGSSTVYNHLYPPATTVEENTGWSWIEAPFGPALRAAGGSTQAKLTQGSNDDWVDMGGESTLTFGALWSCGISSSFNQYIGQVIYATWDYNWVFFHSQSQGPIVRLNLSDGAMDSPNSGTGHATAGEWYFIVGTYSSADGVRLYHANIDDDVIAQSSATTTYSGTLDDKSSRDRRLGNAESSGGSDIALAFSGNRWWSHEEVQECFNDPFALVRPSPLRLIIPFVPAAAGGTTHEATATTALAVSTNAVAANTVALVTATVALSTRTNAPAASLYGAAAATTAFALSTNAPAASLRAQATATTALEVSTNAVAANAVALVTGTAPLAISTNAPGGNLTWTATATVALAISVNAPAATLEDVAIALMTIDSVTISPDHSITGVGVTVDHTAESPVTISPDHTASATIAKG